MHDRVNTDGRKSYWSRPRGAQVSRESVLGASPATIPKSRSLPRALLLLLVTLMPNLGSCSSGDAFDRPCSGLDGRAGELVQLARRFDIGSTKVTCGIGTAFVEGPTDSGRYERVRAELAAAGWTLVVTTDRPDTGLVENATSPNHPGFTVVLSQRHDAASISYSSYSQ